MVLILNICCIINTLFGFTSQQIPVLVGYGPAGVAVWLCCVFMEVFNLIWRKLKVSHFPSSVMIGFHYGVYSLW